MALSAKQKKFIEAYLVTFNATEAARQAKYKGDDATLASVGWENLRKPEISKVIEERLAETAMPAGEVLMRLAGHARGNMGDFVKFVDGRPTFDLEAAALLGKMDLVKKLKTKTRTFSMLPPSMDEASTAEDAEAEGEAEGAEVEVTETTIEFELYDAQAALALLGRAHKLFTDKLDVDHKGLATITADERSLAAKELEEWQTRKKKPDATSNG